MISCHIRPWIGAIVSPQILPVSVYVTVYDVDTPQVTHMFHSIEQTILTFIPRPVQQGAPQITDKKPRDTWFSSL